MPSSAHYVLESGLLHKMKYPCSGEVAHSTVFGDGILNGIVDGILAPPLSASGSNLGVTKIFPELNAAETYDS